MLPSLLLCCLIALTLLALTANATTCGWKSYDFSSLADTDITYRDTTAGVIYTVKLCGVLASTSPCITANPGASVCGAIIAKRTFNDMGEWSSGLTWAYLESLNPGRGVFYTLTTAGANCWDTGSADVYRALIKLQCAAAGTALSMVVTSPVSPPQCEYHFTISTPLACATPPPVCGGVINGEVYSFSTLATGDIVYGSTPTTYALKICGSVTQSGCLGSGLPSGMAACSYQGSAVFDMGEYTSSASGFALTYMDASLPKIGVQFTLTGQQTCASADSPSTKKNWISQIQLACASSYGGMTVSATNIECTTNWLIKTPAGCPPGTTLTAPDVATSSETTVTVVEETKTNPLEDLTIQDMIEQLVREPTTPKDLVDRFLEQIAFD